MSNRGTCEYLDKRLDRAHGRYLAAIRSLAQVRKMQLPAPAPQVQINVASNVAEQQIVAGSAGQLLASPTGCAREPASIEAGRS